MELIVSRVTETSSCQKSTFKIQRYHSEWEETLVFFVASCNMFLMAYH